MKRGLVYLLVVAFVACGSVASAAPIVSMVYTPEAGVVGATVVDMYDLFYESSPGGEFLNYRLIVETTNGSFLQDPVRGTAVSGNHYDDVTLTSGGGPRFDFWANTVYSSLGFDTASPTMSTYDAIAPGQTAVPTSKIDWTLFDTNTLDDNDMSDDAGDPGNPDYIAPYHLARILVTSQSVLGVDRPEGARPLGYIEMRAFDNVTFEQDGVTPKPGIGFFCIGCPDIPEPSTAVLALISLVGLVRFVRRSNG